MSRPVLLLFVGLAAALAAFALLVDYARAGSRRLSGALFGPGAGRPRFVWREIRYATRALWRDRALSAVAVLTLALGLGVNTAVFSVVDAVLLRPLPVANQERIVVFWEQELRHGNDLLEVSLPDFQDWRARTHGFESMSAFASTNWVAMLRDAHGTAPVSYRATSASFFETLGARAALGRTFDADADDPAAAPVVVLSDALWKRRFGGNPGIVGSSIFLAAKARTVIGVMPPDFNFPSGAEVWGPVGPPLAEVARENNWSDEQMRGVGMLLVVGRLRTGVDLAHERSEMDALIHTVDSEHSHPESQRSMRLTPLAHYVFGQALPALLALWAGVALILCIACANVASVLLARSVSRERATLVRLALGAGQGRIVRQALVESSLLATAGGLGGLLLASWTSRVLLVLAPADTPRLDHTSLDWRALAFTAGASLLAALAVGLAPALRIREGRIGVSLRGATSGHTESRGRAIARTIVVAGEVTICVVLSIGAGLTTRSFARLAHADLGFEPEGVLIASANLPAADNPTAEQQRAFYRHLVERVRALPGVVAAGAVQVRPFQFGPIGNDGAFIVEGQPLVQGSFEQNPRTNLLSTTPGYFRAMGIRLLAGRDFSDQDGEKAPPVVVISQSLARRAWPGQDPIGKRLWTSASEDANGQPLWGTVVGVVADTRYRDVQAARFDLYESYLQGGANVPNLAVRAVGNPRALLPAIRQRAAELHDDGLGETTTMVDVVSRVMAPWRFNMFLFGFLAVIALVLALVGISGSLGFMVVQRTREIGVRVALGATRSDVLRLVVGRGMAATLLGIAAGLGLTVGLMRFVSGLLYEVSPSDPTTYAIVAGLLLTMSFLACYIPAQRATRLDPVRALRCD
jgi:putative ABC transport system permease protein